MLGVFLGLTSAAAFGANSIIARRGTLRAGSNYVATITICTGPVFFFVLAAVAGDLQKLKHYSWQAYAFMALSGIAHFALGRTWGYRCIELIGSTRANIVTGLSPIVTTILAAIVLSETITFVMLVGIVCTLGAPLLILREQIVATRLGPKGQDRKILYEGIFCGIGAAIFWGSSPIFVKLGLENGGSPVAGSLIAYLAALIAISPSAFLKKENREDLLRGDRGALELALLSGLSINIAQLLRYVALAFASAIVVTLMLRTSPVWVLCFAFLFNRKEESFSCWVLLGNGLLLVGTFLIILA
jgi:drug/metabolite transporter (DMT)-like permease